MPVAYFVIFHLFFRFRFYEFMCVYVMVYGYVYVCVLEMWINDFMIIRSLSLSYTHTLLISQPNAGIRDLLGKKIKNIIVKLNVCFTMPNYDEKCDSLFYSQSLKKIQTFFSIFSKCIQNNKIVVGKKKLSIFQLIFFHIWNQ